MVTVIVLSVLGAFRVVILPEPLSTESITAEGPVPFSLEVLGDYKTALANLGFTPERFQEILAAEIKNHKHHFTSSSGPNGPSMITAGLDAKAVLNDPLLSIFISDLCKMLGMDYIWNALKISAHSTKTGLTEKLKPTGGFLQHSRLHVIYEKGNKSRVIAMADYWTQDVMSPVHKALFKLLEELPTDHTMNQEAGFESVLALCNKPGIGQVYSLDLSAATDRLPIWCQGEILSYLTGNPKFGET